MRTLARAWWMLVIGLVCFGSAQARKHKSPPTIDPYDYVTAKSLDGAHYGLGGRWVPSYMELAKKSVNRLGLFPLDEREREELRLMRALISYRLGDLEGFKRDRDLFISSEKTRSEVRTAYEDYFGPITWENVWTRSPY